MGKEMSLALLGIGVLLIILGISAARSFSSDMSRLFTGAPSDRAIWLLVGGAVLAIAGVLGLSKRS